MLHRKYRANFAIFRLTFLEKLKQLHIKPRTKLKCKHICNKNLIISLINTKVLTLVITTEKWSQFNQTSEFYHNLVFFELYKIFFLFFMTVMSKTASTKEMILLLFIRITKTTLIYIYVSRNLSTNKACKNKNNNQH